LCVCVFIRYVKEIGLALKVVAFLAVGIIIFVVCVVACVFVFKTFGFIIGGILGIIGIGTYGGIFGSGLLASSSRKRYETQMRGVGY